MNDQINEEYDIDKEFYKYINNLKDEMIKSLIELNGLLEEKKEKEWGEISGNDNGKLIEFLKKNYGLDCVESEINKTDDNKKMNIICGEKSLPLNLNNDDTEVNKIIDGVEKENDDLKIGKKKNNEEKIPDISEYMNNLNEQMKKGMEELNKKASSIFSEYKKFLIREREEKETKIKEFNKETMENLMAPLTLLYNVTKTYKGNSDDTKNKELISIFSEFKNFFMNEDIEIINPSLKENFDENFHEIVGNSETDDEQHINKIKEVTRIGCRYDSGKGIVPAKVIIFKKIEGE